MSDFSKENVLCPRCLRTVRLGLSHPCRHGERMLVICSGEFISVLAWDDIPEEAGGSTTYNPA